ncbi:hypothetical protein AX15_004007 [Amanita polypyramis BW_CC]|nr:hypothetical protein AX15_004007 [Amanita polypyramis BW_CC]
MTTTHGFPAGYFVIKSMVSGRVLDVAGDEIEDGTEVLLWMEKEKSLVESLRDPNANHQVFFIDTSGVLCSRSSGHAIDVEGMSDYRLQQHLSCCRSDGRLVLRHRRPVSHPYPNFYSHPLPHFSYSQQTGEIIVTFECDPSFPSPTHQPSEAWRNKRYLLTSVPLRKPRSIIDDASEFISNAITSPLVGLSNMLSGGAGHDTKERKDVGRQLPARPDEVFDGEIDLKETEIVEEERGEEGEVDDSPEMGRKVAVVGVPVGERENAVSRQTKARRTWAVQPLRRQTAKTSHTVT